MAKEYFNSGFLSVTNQFVKARTRSIQLDTLESVELTRPLFLLALAICGGLIGMGLTFGDLLFTHEIMIMITIGVGALLLTWQIGTFAVYSKLTGAKGWSVTGQHRRLRALRAAVERALEDSRNPKSSKSSGSVTPEDEDEDQF